VTRNVQAGFLRRACAKLSQRGPRRRAPGRSQRRPYAPFFGASIACRINPGSNCGSKPEVGGATFETTQTAPAKTIAIAWTGQAKELEVMRNVDRAPEPTLQDIFATIRRLPTDPGQTGWPDQAPASDTSDSVRTLSNAILAIESAMSALKELPASPPSPEADAAPALADTVSWPKELARDLPEPDEAGASSFVDAMSWPDELAQDPAEAENSRPRSSTRRPRKARAAGGDAPEGFALAAMSDMVLKDALRPLLRRWLDENMAIAFDKSLRDELKQTGTPRWKVRWHRNRWRRWSRHAR
jgi:cell pole-organizing protein PopZ